MVCSERRLVHIIGVDTHLMISGAKVQLCEIAGTMELVKQLLDHRYRELVLDGDGIECPVVDAKPPGVVLFLDQQNRC